MTDFWEVGLLPFDEDEYAYNMVRNEAVRLTRVDQRFRLRLGDGPIRCDVTDLTDRNAA